MHEDSIKYNIEVTMMHLYIIPLLKRESSEGKEGRERERGIRKIQSACKLYESCI